MNLWEYRYDLTKVKPDGALKLSEKLDSVLSNELGLSRPDWIAIQDDSSLFSEIEEFYVQQVKQNPQKLLESAYHFELACAALLKIQDKRGATVSLIPNESQARLFQKVFEMRDVGRLVRMIIWKGRQQGLSTGVAAFNFLSLIAQSKSALIITDEKGGSAQNLWNMYDLMDNKFPVELPHDSSNRGKARRYQSGSSIRVEGEKKVSSFTHQLIHLSEAPFFQRLSATLEMVLQTVPASPDTAIFMESAANEFGMQSQEDWQNEWNRAAEGKSDFEALFIPWYVHEEYKQDLTLEETQQLHSELGYSEDAEYGNEEQIREQYDLSFEALAWRRDCIRNKCSGSVYKFQRQYPNSPEECMQAGGLHVFDMGRLKTHTPVRPKWIGTFITGHERRGELSPSHQGVVSIWHGPEPGAEYVAGSDHAEGLPSGDFNCGYIARRLPLQIVARVRGRDGNRLSPAGFAEQMYHLLQYYNQPYYCPENNLDGGTVSALMLEKYAYPNLVNEKMLSLSKQPRPGWRNNVMTRKLVINLIVEVFDDDMIEILDGELLDEMRTFIRVNGRPQAIKKSEIRKPGDPESGFYDDRIFSLGGLILAHVKLPPPTVRAVNLPTLEERLALPITSEPEANWLNMV